MQACADETSNPQSVAWSNPGLWLLPLKALSVDTLFGEKNISPDPGGCCDLLRASQSPLAPKQAPSLVASTSWVCQRETIQINGSKNPQTFQGQFNMICSMGQNPSAWLNSKMASGCSCSSPTKSTNMVSHGFDHVWLILIWQKMSGFGSRKLWCTSSFLGVELSPAWSEVEDGTLDYREVPNTSPESHGISLVDQYESWQGEETGTLDPKVQNGFVWNLA